MKQLLSVAALSAASALVVAACGGSSNSAASGSMDARTRDAMPSSSTVAMAPPSSSSSAHREVSPDSSVGDSSVFLADTVQLGVSVNTGVIWTLGLLKSITDLTPNSCTDTACTWGPGALALDPVSWKFEVSYDAGSGAYDYTLSGQAKSGGDGQFHSVVTGTATPTGVAHRGTGNFTVDLDESHALNPNKSDVGKLQVSYSNATAGTASINATFLGTADSTHAGQTDNALYTYAEDGIGGGSLQAAARNLTSGNLLSIDSRWVASGAGRADVGVTIKDGTGSAFTATESECWASSTSTTPAPYHVVYFSSSDAANLGADSGSAANCAFATAQPTSLNAP